MRKMTTKEGSAPADLQISPAQEPGENGRINTAVQDASDHKSGEGERTRRLTQPGAIGDFFRWATPPQIKPEPEEVLPQHWEAQWREFLNAMQSPNLDQGDPKSSSDALQQRAKRTHRRRPRGGGSVRSPPTLQGEVEQACGNPNAKVKGRCRKAKATLLERGAVRTEVKRQHFRNFCFQDAKGPREVCGRLRELCRRWLKPESRTKEEILELLILEQFLAILPVDMQSWVREHEPDTCAQAVALAEDVLRRQRGTRRRKQQQVPDVCRDVAVSSSKAERVRSDPGPKQLFKEAKAEGDPGVSSPGRRRAGGSCMDERANRSVENGPSSSVRKTEPGEGNLPIPESGRRAPRTPAFIKHQRVHVAQRPHQCPECGKRFTQRSSLTIHRRIHTGEKPYPCPQCGKCFRQSSNLLKHQRIHSGEKPHQCPECGKSFAQRSNLLIHQRTHTGEMPYVCSECGESFSQHRGLIAHQRSHTGEVPGGYSCPNCEKCFQQSSDLTKHLRVHTGEKPYSCLECGKSFRYSSNLSKHQRTHTGEKPYICNVCGKSFSHLSTHNTHQRVHTGERPFGCVDCGKRFISSSKLTRHTKGNSGQSPYICDECGRSFCSHSALTAHERIHSKESPHKESYPKLSKKGAGQRRTRANHASALS